MLPYGVFPLYNMMVMAYVESVVVIVVIVYILLTGSSVFYLTLNDVARVFREGL